MYKRILCATDGSEHAEIAVKQAVDLAKSEGAKLAFAMVNVAVAGPRGPLMYRWEASYVAKTLEAARASAVQAGLSDVEVVEIKSRDAAAAIVNYADEHAIDNIVTGTGDRNALSRLGLSSFAREVSAKAHCSVTVAR
jgi:nucleotide-binding universal stress UspA family protein